MEVGDGNVAPDGRDTFGGVQVFHVLHDEPCESRSEWSFDTFRCAGLSHLLQGAKSANQRDRGLLPNARHTGQPIGWVTFQDRDVEILRRGDTETLDHGIGIQERPRIHPTLHGHDNTDLPADELHEVTITGDDHRGITPVTRCSSKRPGDIVGFKLPNAHDRYTPSLQNLADGANLWAEFIGFGFFIPRSRLFLDAVCFVARDEVDPPFGAPIGVPGA